MPTVTEPSTNQVPLGCLATRNRLCCAKILKYIGRNRNRVRPTRPTDTNNEEYFEVSARRIIHVLRPSLKSERFYEPQTGDRPESINDNFYTRWARRPHPSGNCRCSFRSSRLSSHEEVVVAREIDRIRASLREGTGVEELETSLAIVEREVASGNCSGSTEVVRSRIEPLDEQVKRRIVKDLDRYINDLLDEILNETIRAIARSDDPFGDRQRDNGGEGAEGTGSPPTFDIKFSFHSSEDGNSRADPCAKGYVNRGFVGSASDPDTLDYHHHLRHRGLIMGNDRAIENPDCVDSGINSVETVELQAQEQEQEQELNLEQSLMDIIDAKLGGSSIGKSLENLGMEIDEVADDSEAKRKEEEKTEEIASETPNQDSKKVESTQDGKPTQEEDKKQKKAVVENAPSQQRTSASLDDAIEEPAPFDSLRLEFKQQRQQQQQQQKRSSDSPNKRTVDEPSSAKRTRRRVTSRFNKTLTMIQRRLVRRLNASRRKRNNNNNNNNNNSNNNNNNDKPSKSSTSFNKSTGSLRAHQLRPDDLHRRRFPHPPPPRRPEISVSGTGDSIDGEVTLRRHKRKPTIVFLHGFGSSADVFSTQLSYFAELGYPCLAPDMLGHGFSSAPNRASEYKFDKLLNDLEVLLLHYAFKPGQKCVIVAHNYGFATALAQKYASNVHQLVLIAGGGPIPLAPPPAREGPGHCCLRSCLSPFLVCGMSRSVMYSARGRQHPYCGPEEAPWASTHLRHVQRGMSWPEGDHVFLRRILTPTLLVHGLRDNKVSLVQECQMERTMGKAVLEAIPSAGHVPMTDCPEQLNHMIHCFIDLWKNKKW